MNHSVILEHYEMIETDKHDDNERTRARAVYVKIRMKERRDVTGVCISGQGRLHGLHEPVCKPSSTIAGKYRACERRARRLETLEIPWVRNTELAAHSAKTIRDNKGDGRKLIPDSESVDAT